MSRVRTFGNTYTTPIAGALQDFGNAVLANIKSPTEQAEIDMGRAQSAAELAEAQRAAADHAFQNDQRRRLQAQLRGGVPTATPQAVPGWMGNAYANAIGAGMEMDDISALSRAMLSYYTDDPDMLASAQFASEGAYDPTLAFSNPHAIDLRQEAHGNEVSLQGQAERASLAQALQTAAQQNRFDVDAADADRQHDINVLGIEAATQAARDRLAHEREQEMARLEAELDPPDPIENKPLAYITPDGREGTTFDGGLTDAHTGESLPPQTRAFRIGVETNDPSTLTSTMQTRAQDAAVSLKTFEGDLARWRQIIDEAPHNQFGSVGNINRFAHGMYSQIKGLADAVPGIDTQMVDNMFSVITDNTDPNYTMHVLPTFADFLAYSAAASLAGQTGARLSDKDIKHFRGIIGDPTQLFSSKEKMRSLLNELERSYNRRIKVYNELNANSDILQGTTRPENTGAATPPPANAASGGGGVVRWDDLED